MFLFKLDTPTIKDGGGNNRYLCCKYLVSSGHGPACRRETQLNLLNAMLRRAGISGSEPRQIDLKEVLPASAVLTVSYGPESYLSSYEHTAEGVIHSVHADEK